MSTRPRAASASAARRRTSSEQERSAGTATAADPSSRTMPAQSSALRELITTRAPSRTYARAMPRPMPLVEPVTMAVLPSSRPLIASRRAGRSARRGSRAPTSRWCCATACSPEGADSPLMSGTGSPSPCDCSGQRARSDDDADLDGFRRLMSGKGVLDALEREAVGDERPDADDALGEEPHCFGKLLAVDHGAHDADLAPHDGEEVHRGGLVRKPGEHDASPWVRELEGLLDGAGRPRRLDHHVDALASREGPRGRHAATHLRGGEVVGPQRPSQLVAAARPSHREDAQTVRLEHLDG